MLNVYFEDKIITFTQESPKGGGTVVPEGDGIGIAKVLQNLENSKHLWIKAVDAHAAFAKFRAQFLPVTAAGGLVVDGAGKNLMILRNGRWDLPKGHLEPGESIEACALREVEEECGVGGLTVDGLLARTLHFYRMRGRWEMKETWWYAMHTDGCPEPRPQREEGIVRAEWIAPEEVAALLERSFETIREVFRRAGMRGI